LIVSAVKDGKELKYQNLEEVWNLTYDKVKFLDYVESATRKFISGPADSAGPQQANVLETGAAAPTGNRTPAGKRTLVAYYFHGDARVVVHEDRGLHRGGDQGKLWRAARGWQLNWQVVNIDSRRTATSSATIAHDQVIVLSTAAAQGATWKNSTSLGAA